MKNITFVILILFSSVANAQVLDPKTDSAVNVSIVKRKVPLKSDTIKVEVQVPVYIHDTVCIDQPVNQLPVANAGTAKTITLPTNTVTLAGSGTDADGTITSYLWTKVSGPATPVIATPANASTSITNLVQGTYVFRLTVTDNKAATGSAEVTITVNPAPPVGTRNNIILDANFEGSNPFSGLLDEQQYCCSYSVTQSSTIAHEGNSSFRAEVRRNDPQKSGGYRAEITKKSITHSGDMWYGFSVYFQTPVGSNGNWSGGYGGHFFQWHPASGTGSASLALWGSDGLWDVCINPSGSSSVTHQSRTFSGGALQRIVGNTWNDVVFHVNWSTGLVEVWINGVKYFQATGLSWKGGEYIKIGPNRWNMTNDWVIYYDNIRIARSGNGYTCKYSDVAPEGAIMP